MSSAPLPAQEQAENPPPTPLRLMWMFVGVALAGIGGGLPAHTRRAVIQRGWLTDLQFAESFTLAQLTPGPNAANLAAMIGVRLTGKMGALLSVIGVLLPGMVTMLLVTLAALGLSGGLPAPLQSGLRGAACAALGVMLTAAMPVLKVGAGVRWGWVFIVLTFVALGLLRWNLLPVLLVLLSAGLVIHRPQRKGNVRHE